MLALLDPGLVVPHAGQGAQSAQRALDSIVDISAGVRDGELELLSSDLLYEVLAALDLFPLDRLYDDLLASLKLDHCMSGSDVTTLVLGILERSVPMENIVAAYDLDAAVPTSVCGLGSVCSCHAEFDDACTQAMLMGVACGLADPSWEPDFIASHRGSGEPIQVAVTFATILASDGSLAQVNSFDSALPSAATLADALPLVDPVRVLRRCSRSRTAVRSAISVELRQRSPEFAGPAWSLHSWFVEDVTSPAVLNNEGLLRRALRASVDVITDSCPRDSHALRLGRGAGERQITRGGCRAWRQDVDREWHLHFWRCAEGRLQLATLRGHAYVGIPDPEP